MENICSHKLPITPRTQAAMMKIVGSSLFKIIGPLHVLCLNNATKVIWRTITNGNGVLKVSNNEKNIT